MAPENESRRGTQSEDDGFDGRDLLVGRPARAEAATRAAEVSQTPPPAAETSPSMSSPPGGAQPDGHDDAIGGILATVQTIAARLDALQDTPEAKHGIAEALARETAALSQAVRDAQGALAKAEELATRQDGAAEAARVLAQGVAALKAQGEALDRSLHTTGRLAEATARQAKENGWQSEVTAQGIAEMNRTARLLQSSLRVHMENITRFDDAQRLRFWLTVLAMAAASFGFFTLGALL